jgi:hypothetical protein
MRNRIYGRNSLPEGFSSLSCDRYIDWRLHQGMGTSSESETATVRRTKITSSALILPSVGRQ